MAKYAEIGGLLKKGLSQTIVEKYSDNKEIISIDKNYFRPTEVESLLGDSKFAKKELKLKNIIG